MDVTAEMLDLKQLARLLSLPISTLAFWRATGTGPAYHKTGRVIRYSRVDVAAWLEAQKVEPSA